MVLTYRRVRRHIAWRIRRASAPVGAAYARSIDLLRRGNRTVILTPPAGLRVGNFLYLWLRAHQRTAGGSATLVRAVPGMEQWLALFPLLAPLTVTEHEIRFSDRREWDNTFLYQRFGVDFDDGQLDSFVKECLGAFPSGDSDRLVINVRRGDYYTDHREKYAFDVVGYITAALLHFQDVSAIQVVSDDPVWCRENLDARLRDSTSYVEYAQPDPKANLLAVASARRIIGTNSTFSYWGAYIATATWPDVQVVMPEFHGRMAHGTAAHQLHPRWTVISGYH